MDAAKVESFLIVAEHHSECCLREQAVTQGSREDLKSLHKRPSGF